jgi:hypothetical protein
VALAYRRCKQIDPVDPAERPAWLVGTGAKAARVETIIEHTQVDWLIIVVRQWIRSVRPIIAHAEYDEYAEGPNGRIVRGRVVDAGHLLDSIGRPSAALFKHRPSSAFLARGPFRSRKP